MVIGCCFLWPRTRAQYPRKGDPSDGRRDRVPAVDPASLSGERRPVTGDPRGAVAGRWRPAVERARPGQHRLAVAARGAPQLQASRLSQEPLA